MSAPSTNRLAANSDSHASLTRELPVIPPSPLPALYAAWIDQLLAGPLPQESNATWHLWRAKNRSPMSRSEVFNDHASFTAVTRPFL